MGSARKRVQSEELDELMEDARRRLKLPIHCVLLGIRGEPARSAIGASANTPPGFSSFAQLATDDAQKAEIQKVVEALDELIVATDAIEEGLDEMMEQVRTSTRALETILPKPATPEGAAVESDLPGGDLPGDAGGEEAAAQPAKKS